MVEALSERPKRAIAALFVAYAILVPLGSNIYLPDGLRVAWQNNRAIVALILIGASLAVLLITGYRPLRKREWNIFLLALVFPITYSILSVIKGRPDPAVIILYFSWPVYAFLLPAMLFRRVSDIRFMVGLMLVGYLFLFGAGSLLAAAGGERSGLVRPATAGYLNENYYGQVLQVIVASGWLFYAARPPIIGRSARRIKHLSLALGAIVGTWMLLIGARGVTLFLFASIIAFAILRNRRSMLVLGALPLFVLTGCGVVALYLGTFSPGDLETSGSINAASSGRINLWTEAVDQVGSGTLGALGWVVGPLEEPTFGAARYDPLGAQREYEKFRADNSYLELILESGLVGTALFVAPYVLVFRIGLKAADESPLMTWSLAILVGLATHAVVSTTFPTFGSPMGVAFGFLAVVPSVLAHVSSAQPSSKRSSERGDLLLASTSIRGSRERDHVRPKRANEAGKHP